MTTISPNKTETDLSSVGRTFYLVGAAMLAASLGQSAAAADKKILLKTPSAFNTQLPVIGTSATYFADLAKSITGGTVRFKLYEPGKLMPAFEIHKSVSTGKVDAGYTCSAYLGGSLKEAIPFCTFPFSPHPEVFMAWLYQGNGMKLYQKMYDDAGYKLKVLPISIYSSEGAGWFTKKIEKVEDWKGVKLRIGGFAAPTLKKLGAVPTLIPFNEIFPGLEKGVIDGAEMGLPSNDLRAGLYKVAKFYHMPSWHQPSTLLELVINKDKWDSMSEAQRAQIDAASKATNLWSMTKAAATQTAALEELKSKGVTVVKWDSTMIAAMRKAYKEVITEMQAEHPNLKAVLDDFAAFMVDYKKWESVGMIRRDETMFD